jgi:hypothetical protein
VAELKMVKFDFTVSLMGPNLMQVLLYNQLNPGNIPGFAKLKKYLEADDFYSAEVKKIDDNLYRARLNTADRLLFAIYRYQEQSYALILEYIKNHAYDRSRFLRHKATIDEDKIPAIKNLAEVAPQPLVYLNPRHNSFNLLDKIISFDDEQRSIYERRPPLIVIGSAGSGKTALTLEKMKEAAGDVLYVTQSPYLVKSARDLYYAHGYENEAQQLDFLSFQEFLESIHVPDGKPVSFPAFRDWFGRFRQAGKINDAHKLFEEFRGVLTGAVGENGGWLSREQYLNLGVKQSIFLSEERDAVYDLFEKYRAFLKDNRLYDANLVSYAYLAKIEARYDFIVVDEVQDLTNVQLYLILKSLRQAGDFLLCGDSNQIVHPNFFSWSKVKTLFYQREDLQESDEIIRILNSNYRNSPQVTDIANKILKIKNSRFGSIDKESHYLVKSIAHNRGEVVFLQNTPTIREELDKKTRASTRFAVIVMTQEQKPAAQQFFKTPLVFSIQEAKGLEYENIVLFNFMSDEAQRFREISRGVEREDLQQDLKYARGKDKSDKSLEVYKFYINALYVAITRAVKNLYWIEDAPKQKMLDLDAQASSLDDWRLEAHKLELQGKQEQADKIRNEILKERKPAWEVYAGEALQQLKIRALDKNDKKAKLDLFEYALVYEDTGLLHALVKADFRPASNPKKGLDMLQQKHYLPYTFKKPDTVVKQIHQYGANFRNMFNQTPLMVAAWTGNAAVIDTLHELGADTDLADSNGMSALQIALAQASRDSAYAAKKLPDIYEKLEPDSLSVQIDGRLVKLDNHLMEFFLFNMMLALFYRALPLKVLHGYGGFSTQEILDAVQHIPDAVLPERRKKRAYISSILSKNEIHRDDRYNRKLFVRVSHGHYLFSPGLSLKIGGEWLAVYDLVSIERLACKPMVEKDWWYEDYNARQEQRMAVQKDRLAQWLDSVKNEAKP